MKFEEKETKISKKYALILLYVICGIIAVYFTNKIIHLSKLSNPYYEISDLDKKIIVSEFKNLPMTSRNQLIEDIDKFLNKDFHKFNRTGNKNIDKIFNKINFDLERFFISPNFSYSDSESNKLRDRADKELNKEFSKMASGNLSDRDFDKSLYKLERYQKEIAKLEEKKQRKISEIRWQIQKKDEYFSKTIPSLMAIMKEINPNYKETQPMVSIVPPLSKTEPSLPKIEPPPFNEELMGIKYAMTIENGNLFCYVNDSWNSVPFNIKKKFITQIGKEAYFGKTDFILRNSKGKDVAEYNNGTFNFPIRR